MATIIDQDKEGSQPLKPEHIIKNKKEWDEMMSEGFYSRFKCQICEESQDVNISEMSLFLICDQCKKDLKEIVLEKRNPK